MIELLWFRIAVTAAGLAFVAWAYRNERKSGKLTPTQWVVLVVLLVVLTINPWIH